MPDINPLPFRPEVEEPEAAPRVIGLDEDDAHQVFDALSSETAREIYCVLLGDPRTPPELAEKVGCSLQTVHYHLRSLDETDLVEPADTGYSEKGVEMTIYRVADRPLVITSADQDEKSGLRRFLARILGAACVLGLSSLIVQWWLSRSDGGVGSRVTANTTAPVHGFGFHETFPPGALFFVGGLVALVTVAVLWYWLNGWGPGVAWSRR